MFLANTPKMKRIDRQQGVTLIEIVVTVLIMSIGLLGLAALQNTSMKLAYDSYLRTQAAFLAYDLIDRIRANPDTTYQLSPGATISAKDCFSGDTCTPSDLRQYDLYHWKKQAETLLPDATLELEFDSAFSTYSMKLKWDDRYDTDTDQAAGDESKEFIYHFQVGAS